MWQGIGPLAVVHSGLFYGLLWIESEFQGQVEWGSEQPSLVEVVPEGFELDEL